MARDKHQNRKSLMTDPRENDESNPQPEAATPERGAFGEPVAAPQDPAYADGHFGFKPEQPTPGADPAPAHAKRPVGFIAGVAALSLVLGLAGGAAAGAVVAASHDGDQGTSQSQSAPVAKSKDSGITSTDGTVNSPLSAVIANSMSSVVTISVRGSSDAGTGSGVVLTDSGYIMTNAHVVTLEGKSRTGTYTVLTSSGDIYTAKLVGYDSLADTAVLKIQGNAKGIKPITFANSDDVKVGDTTIAIGSPLGLSGTVTTGIVSAVARPISVASSEVGANPNSYVSLISTQTDAAINSGNSGGALLNARGDLIGMNDAIATSGQSSGNIGIGFSIPANYAKRIADELIATGKATHGRIGATVQDGTASNTTFTTGAQIVSISPDSAAAQAGLRAKDLIVKLNNVVITDATQLTALVRSQAPGTNVKLTYKRDGVQKTITVKLGS
jgi:putative serine protease PepD